MLTRLYEARLVTKLYRAIERLRLSSLNNCLHHCSEHLKCASVNKSSVLFSFCSRFSPKNLFECLIDFKPRILWMNHSPDAVARIVVAQLSHSTGGSLQSVSSIIKTTAAFSGLFRALQRVSKNRAIAAVEDGAFADTVPSQTQ